MRYSHEFENLKTIKHVEFTMCNFPLLLAISAVITGTETHPPINASVSGSFRLKVIVLLLSHGSLSPIWGSISSSY